jgi:hypothetical protein
MTLLSVLPIIHEFITVLSDAEKKPLVGGNEKSVRPLFFNFDIVFFSFLPH